MFLGHLGTAELGAAALATAYNNLMWFFLLGFATALDTLGSHAYGAGDHRCGAAMAQALKSWPHVMRVCQQLDDRGPAAHYTSKTPTPKSACPLACDALTAIQRHDPDPPGR